MAITTRVVILLLAYVLVATTMVSSIEEQNDSYDMQHYRDEKSPSIAPVHPPKRQPAVHHSRPPVKAPFHAPAKPPTSSNHGHPNKAPAHAPVPSSTGCIPLCLEYCRGNASKRMCMRTCSACCSKTKCVPVGHKKCSYWDHVYLHGAWIKCP